MVDPNFVAAIANATDAVLTNDGKPAPHDGSQKMQADYGYNLSRFMAWLQNVARLLSADGYTFKPKPNLATFAAANLNDSLDTVRYAISIS